MLRTAAAYFDVALAHARLRLLDTQLAAVRQAEDEAQDRFNLGDRPITAVHEARARAAALASERLVASNRLQLARDAFADLTGLSAAPADFRPPARPPVDELGTLEDWLARAEHANPALRLARSQLQTAEVQAEASAGQFAPTIELVGAISRDRLAGSGDFGSASNTGANRALGLRLSVPLSTSGMRGAQNAEARAGVSRARAELARLRQEVLQQVRGVWIELAAGGEETGALDAAAEAGQARLDATQVGLEAGDRTTLDLLNASNDSASAALNLMEARRRLTLRRLELAALAGELGDGTLERVNAQALGPP
jgi:outer membrane protein